MAKSKEIGGGAARGGSITEPKGFYDTDKAGWKELRKAKVKISPRDEAIKPKTRAEKKRTKKALDELNRVSFGLYLDDKAKAASSLLPPRTTGGITGRGASAVNPLYRNMGN